MNIEQKIAGYSSFYAERNLKQNEGSHVYGLQKWLYDQKLDTSLTRQEKEKIKNTRFYTKDEQNQILKIRQENREFHAQLVEASQSDRNRY